MNYKYYVIYTSNGNLQLDKVAEKDDITKAIKTFHEKCEALWNEPTVYEAYVEIIYSLDMNVVSYDGTTYKEHITHPQPIPNENTGA